VGKKETAKNYNINLVILEKLRMSMGSFPSRVDLKDKTTKSNKPEPEY
jgi:hypothetical protein